jgi:hypothetical protein
MDNLDLYSIAGGEPEPLPHRIKFPDGRTKTDNTTFTKEDLINVNITGPYIKPSVEEYQNVIWDRESMEYKIFDTPDEHLYSLIRSHRNDLLQESDWTQLVDCKLSKTLIEEYQTYRQMLRDFPSTITNPKTQILSWPVSPHVKLKK